MKKVILTVVVLVVGFAGFAQENANTTEESKYVTTSNGSVLFRMTDDMTNDEIRLEFINNFFKIELSDLVIGDEESQSIDQEKFNDKAVHRIKDESNMSNKIITSDLAIRTTLDMRPSLYSTEQITA